MNESRKTSLIIIRIVYYLDPEQKNAVVKGRTEAGLGVGKLGWSQELISSLDVGFTTADM